MGAAFCSPDADDAVSKQQMIMLPEGMLREQTELSFSSETGLGHGFMHVSLSNK